MKKGLSINIRGKLMDFSQPRIMGIVNTTPDSFYSDSRVATQLEVEQRVMQMKADGVDIIDIGGCSTRPGSPQPTADEEMQRLAYGLNAIRRAWPDAIISVDTYRAQVARWCVEDFEADIINDVSGGTLDKDMWATVAKLKVPYILMHMRGTPSSMQSLTDYNDVTADVILDLAKKIDLLHGLGIADIIVDPGFGFAKTTQQNFQLLGELQAFNILNLPLLVGISRKGMIWKTLGIDPAMALNGTTVLNTIALLNGADILRVHDVKQAAETLKLVQATRLAAPLKTIAP